MNPQAERSTQEVLAGLVERVTYHNAENGFCVLRAKARGHREMVTVVGHAATIAAGEWDTCPFRKFHPAQIRIVRQNHHIFESVFSALVTEHGNAKEKATPWDFVAGALRNH
jgi:hypothetical protein